MTMKTNPNDPAHPLVTEYRDNNGGTRPGLTKREYFAAAALQGLLANPVFISEQSDFAIRKAAVEHADGMIERLNKEQS